jgi:hypothetical protein
MVLTDTELAMVEHLAQMQIRYEIIIAEQGEVFRTDMSSYNQAAARLQQTSFVAKSGQDWQPTDDKVDDYFAKCDEICRTIPHDINELSFVIMQLS